MKRDPLSAFIRLAGGGGASMGIAAALGKSACVNAELFRQADARKEKGDS